MISIPPYFLLFPFGAFLCAFLFFSIANIVSLAKYGARNAVGFFVTFVFICGAAVILFLTWQALAQLAWVTPVPLFSIQSLTL